MQELIFCEERPCARELHPALVRAAGCVQKGGGFGQFALLPLRATAVRPPTIEPAQAACLGVAGGTALISVRDYTSLPLPSASGTMERHAPPMNVLVAGASGGVGHFAVQVSGRVLYCLWPNAEAVIRRYSLGLSWAGGPYR